VISETPNSGLVEGASSESLDRRQETGNRETLIGENARKASLLFNSTSQFNDLDYFLNPGKATARGKNESTVKIPDTRASFPKVNFLNKSNKSSSLGLLPSYYMKKFSFFP
jgi:hypothetical protein